MRGERQERRAPDPAARAHDHAGFALQTVHGDLLGDHDDRGGEKDAVLVTGA
jgi:hypothetical protein